MKKEILELLRGWGYWRIAYSGKTRTFYIHDTQKDDTATVELSVSLHYPDSPYKVVFQ